MYPRYYYYLDEKKENCKNYPHVDTLRIKVTGKSLLPFWAAWQFFSLIFLGLIARERGMLFPGRAASFMWPQLSRTGRLPKMPAIKSCKTAGGGTSLPRPKSNNSPPPGACLGSPSSSSAIQPIIYTPPHRICDQQRYGASSGASAGQVYCRAGARRSQNTVDCPQSFAGFLNRLLASIMHCKNQRPQNQIYLNL